MRNIRLLVLAGLTLSLGACDKEQEDVSEPTSSAPHGSHGATNSSDSHVSATEGDATQTEFNNPGNTPTQGGERTPTPSDESEGTSGSHVPPPTEAGTEATANDASPAPTMSAVTEPVSDDTSLPSVPPFATPTPGSGITLVPGTTPTAEMHTPSPVQSGGPTATPRPIYTPVPTTPPDPTPTYVPGTEPPDYKVLGTNECGLGQDLTPGIYFGSTRELLDTVNPICAPNGAPGYDTNFHVYVPSREYFRVNVLSSSMDVVLHRGVDCERYDRSCVDASDLDADAIESLSHLAPLGGESIDFYVDSALSGGGDYRMEVSLGDTMVKMTEVSFEEITGDGDNLQETGETWKALATLENVGEISTQEITAQLDSSTGGITFDAQFATLGNMGSGGQQTMAIPYRINPAEEATRVRVTLSLFNSLGRWYDSFEVVLGNPDFFKCPDHYIGPVLGTAAFKGTTESAVNNMLATCHNSGTGPEVSLEWVAPETGRYTFDTNGSEVNDTTLFALDEGCGGPEIACNDDNGDGFLSEMTLEAIGGQHYLIVVEAFKSEDAGPFQLNINRFSEPTPTAAATPYDCADYDLGTEVGAGIWTGPSQGQVDDFSPDCSEGIGGEDVALLWTAPEAGTYTFDTKGSDVSDTVIYLVDDGCRPYNLVCNDDDYGRLSSVTYAFEAGESIHVILDEYNASTIAGGFQLNVTKLPDDTPTPEPCPDIDLGTDLGAPVYSGSLAAAANTFQGSCTFGTTGLDYSFQWTAPNDGIYSFDTVGSEGDTVLYFLDGSCDGEEIYCDDDSAGSLLSAITREFLRGESVVIVVDAYSATASGDFDLNIYRIGGLTPTPGEGTPTYVDGIPPCPEFDIGSDIGEAVFDGVLDNNGDDFRGNCTSGSGGDDVSIAWTSPFRGAFVFDTNGSEILDTVIYVLRGGCYGLEATCDDDDGEGFLSSAELFSEAGEDYIIVVDAYNDDRKGPFILNIAGEEILTPTPTDTPEVTPTPTPIPENCPQIKLGNEVGSPVFTGDLTDLGNDFQGGCTRGTTGEDLTFQWSAPYRGTFIFDTIGSSILPDGMTDSVIYVLQESCDGVSIGCNDDASGLLSAVEVELFKNDEVVIVVDGYSQNSSGAFQLNITGTEYTEPTETPLPPGTMTPGSCPEIDLAGALGEPVYTGDLLEAKNDFKGTCTNGISGEDVSFGWVAPFKGTFTFHSGDSELIEGATTDTVLYLLEESCTGPELACDDDFGEGYLSSVTVDLEQGTSLVVVVDGYNVSNSAPFALSIIGEPYQTPTEVPTQAPTPVPWACPENDLGSALGDGLLEVDLRELGDDYLGSCTFGSLGADATFLWTAPHSGIFRFDTNGSSASDGGATDTVLYLLEGGCEGSEIACDDDSGTGFLSQVVVGLDEGNSVIIVADAFDEDKAGKVWININDVVEVTPTPTLPLGPTDPPIDEFACINEDLGSAMGEKVYEGDNTGRTNDESGECGGNSGRDIGLLWTAPESGSFTFDTDGSDFDTVLYARVGSCLGSDMACSDDVDGAGSPSSFSLTGVTAGTTLVIVIDAFGSSDEGIAVLNITRVDDGTVGEGGIDPEAGTRLFFSEYLEGSSFNKAVEIYNGTGASVDLGEYELVLGANGVSYGDSDLRRVLSGTLEAGDVIVLCHEQADPSILSRCDIPDSDVVNFNGNDAIGLIYNAQAVDTIGVSGTQPGADSWDVAGGIGSTANYTLRRKPEVNGGVANWATAAGTSEASSQWEVFANNTADYLGSHPHTDDGLTTVTFMAEVPDPGVSKVHLTGSIELLGSWQADAIPMTQVSSDSWQLSLDMPDGTEFNYKYTLGTWETVEKGSNGEELPERVGVADEDKTLEDQVEKWATVPAFTPTPEGTSTPSEPTVPLDTACVDYDLGSAVGAEVFIGSNGDQVDDYEASCASGVSGGREIALLWQAPASGSYVIDTFGTVYDTVLDIRFEGCEGNVLMCNDDSLDSSSYYQSRAAVTVSAGEHLVLIVDAYDNESIGEAVVNIEAQ